MRWPPLLLLVLAAACNWPLTGDTGTGGSTTDGGTSCAAANPANCSDCQTCAANGPCSSLVAACNSSPDCQYVYTCATSCGGDAACVQGCYSQNPNGEGGYQALASCLYCQQCPCSGRCGQ
jgi:hypothetical protein